MLDAGAKVALGSDWPVAPLDPLAGIGAAVHRRTLDGANPEGWVPEQRISVEEALTGYTRGNAYAGFQDDKLGIIAPNRLADLTIFDRDLLAIDPEDISKAKVLRTMVGGEEVYVAH